MARARGPACRAGAPAAPRLRRDRRRRGLRRLGSRNGAPGAPRRRRAGRSGLAASWPVHPSAEDRGGSARLRGAASSSRTGSPCSPPAIRASRDTSASTTPRRGSPSPTGRSTRGAASTALPLRATRRPSRTTSAAATPSARSCRSGSAPQLVGEDVAWVFQPYIAFLAALLALALFALARPLVRSVWAACLRRVRRRSAGTALRLLAVERGEGDRRRVPDRRGVLRSLTGKGAAKGLRSGLPVATAAAALAGVLSLGRPRLARRCRRDRRRSRVATGNALARGSASPC